MWQLAAASADAFGGRTGILDFLPLALMVLVAAIVGALVLLAFSLIRGSDHHAHR
jgi:hypothetical protein